MSGDGPNFSTEHLLSARFQKWFRQILARSAYQHGEDHAAEMTADSLEGRDEP